MMRSPPRLFYAVSTGHGLRVTVVNELLGAWLLLLRATPHFFFGCGLAPRGDFAYYVRA